MMLRSQTKCSMLKKWHSTVSYEKLLSVLLLNAEITLKRQMSISIVNLPDPLYFSFFGVLKNDHKNIITHGNLHQSNFPLHFQWDIIVRRSSLVNAFNLPDYGYEPWNSLHDFDEIFDRKFGKPAVG